MLDAPLDPSRPLLDEVRRVADELLGDAELRLRLPGSSGFDKAVHESRKRIKEVRSLLRFLQFSLVDAQNGLIRPALNATLRETSHLIGDAREAAVAIETLDSLDIADASTFRAFLVARHQNVLAGDIADASTDASTRLALIRGEITGWQLTSDGWDAFAPGLKKVYKQGRDAMAEAVDSHGDAECWHDWRKRAKDLRYAAEFLRNGAPHVLGGLAALGKELTDALGDDHDLAELAILARDQDASHVAETAEQARFAKQAAARQFGQRAYAEKPSDFVRRLGTYWHSDWTSP